MECCCKFLCFCCFLGAAGLKKCARLSAAQLASLETGSQLYSASKNANDPESFAVSFLLSTVVIIALVCVCC